MIPSYPIPGIAAMPAMRPLWPAMLMVFPLGESLGKCQQLKCVAVYRESDPCQCFPGCETYGNCCSDFKAVCMNSKEEFRPANPMEVPTEAPTTPKPHAFAAPVHHFAAPAAEKVANVVTGNCAKFGCGGPYNPGHSCQCNAACLNHGSCCNDFASHCRSTAAESHAQSSPRASCAHYGCGSFQKTQSCHCNKQCTVFGSCCHDYAEKCAKHATCKAYGCGTYRRFHACQCNADCSLHGNCCQDFHEECKGSPGKAAHHYGHYGSGTSCAIIGCRKFIAGQPCQCNAGCHHHSNCCPDYDATCGLPAGPLGRCSVFGCIEYRAANDCQCNKDCLKHNTCCPDYVAVCQARDLDV